MTYSSIFISNVQYNDLLFLHLAHLELILTYGVRQGSNFILLYAYIRLSQHHLLKRLFSPSLNGLTPLLKISSPPMYVFWTLNSTPFPLFSNPPGLFENKVLSLYFPTLRHFSWFSFTMCSPPNFILRFCNVSVHVDNSTSNLISPFLNLLSTSIFPHPTTAACFHWYS